MKGAGMTEPGPVRGRSLLPVVGAGALTSACGIGLLSTSGWLITRASQRPPVLSLSIAIGAVQAFSLGRGLARYVERIGVHRLCLGKLGRLRLRLFDVAVPLVPGTVGGNGTAGVLSSFVSDTELVAEGYARSTTAAIEVSASVVLGTVVAALLDPVLGVVLLGAALAVVVVAATLARWGEPIERGAAAERVELAGAVVAAVRSAARAGGLRARGPGRRRPGAGVQTGRGLVGPPCPGQRAGPGRHHPDRGCGRRRGGRRRVGRRRRPSPIRGDPGRGELRRPGCDGPVHEPSRRLRRQQCGASGVGRALGTWNDWPLPSRSRSSTTAPVPGRAGPTSSSAETTSPAGDQILKGVSLRIRDGERVALVGPSGAGKTSAVYALVHFVACSGGHARLGGVEVSTMTREGIATLAGWLPETTHVFAASVIDNLRLGDPSATEPECLAVLDRVGLRRWSAGLPDGLATRLGAGGLPVSAGERQRLGLARVLLAGPPLVLLDEPTAHLDPATGGQVLRELLDAAGDGSALVVSHDPAVPGYVDTVVTLDGGRVAGVSGGGRPGSSPKRLPGPQGCAPRPQHAPEAPGNEQ